MSFVKNYKPPREIERKTSKEKQFKYLIISTGYTGRIGESKEKLDKLVKGFDENEVEAKVDFIYDGALYTVNQTDTKIIDSILKYEQHGIIVFSPRNPYEKEEDQYEENYETFSMSTCFRIGEEVRELEYCINYGLIHIEFVENDILLLTYDCESG